MNRACRKFLCRGCFILALIGLVTGAWGATYTVGPEGDFSTLQAAIDDAGTVNGDTLLVAAGTFTQTTIVVSKSLTIQGAGTSDTVVQAHAIEGSATNRVFTINVGVIVTISDMTVRHGAVTGNPARGGGVYNAGTLTLSKVKICNNRATGVDDGYAYGGGLCAAGTTTVDQCLFADNLVQGGNDGDDGYDGMGGGAYVGGNQIATFTRCTFSGNAALGGTVAEDNNCGYGYGGGISDANIWQDPAVITIVNCTFSGNMASKRGGGIAGGGATVILKHCTIANNSASDGGGIFSSTSNDNTGPILYHTIVANNTGTWGPDFIYRIQSRGYNLIEMVDGNGTIDIAGNGNTATGNIIGSDPMLTPLADFGGSTQTCALQDGSPAIDQIPNGTNGLGVDPLNVDQRGRVRPFGGNGDIGAYEISPTTPTVSTTAISNITTTSAETGGNVMNDGGAGLLARGVCWNTTGVPTIADSLTDDGSAPDDFTSSLTGLSSGTTYYVRAYATNSMGTAYGNEEVFTTLAKPTLTSPSSSVTGTTTATLGGTISELGGADVTERGIYWSTTSGFTPPGQGTKVSQTGTWSSTGAFTVNVTELPAGSTIYFMAFATNTAETGWSSSASFNTAKENQTITFNALPAKMAGDAAFTLTATASSGLAVTYTSSNTQVATIIGSTVTILGAGTTTITASQAGNSTYNAATNVPQTLTVNPASTPAPENHSVTDQNGQALVQIDLVQAVVDGFDPNLPVVLECQDGDTATLTVGTTGSPKLSVTVEGLEQGTTLNLGANSPSQQETLTLTQPSGRRVDIILVQFPPGVSVGLNLGNGQQILSSITNPAGQAMNVDIQTQDTGGDITFTITYHPPTSAGTAKTIWLTPGGSMTIAASGIPADGVYKLAISYTGVPLGQTQAEDLRLMRIDSDGKLSAISASDMGNISATSTLGDYGIDTASNKVWANVNTLGTFAVGVPKTPVEVLTTTSYGCPFVGGLLLLMVGVFGLPVVRMKD